MLREPIPVSNGFIAPLFFGQQKIDRPATRTFFSDKLGRDHHAATSVHCGAGRGVFLSPRSIPRSGAPLFDGAPPCALRFLNGADRGFYGRDGVFRTVREL